MRIEWIGIEWIRIGGIRIGGIRVEWICVGYVWCEIRQQSSEEPCDETSFGKKGAMSLFISRGLSIVQSLPTYPR